jgi:type II secretory pathway component PulF
MEIDPRPRRGRHVAGRRDGAIAGNFSARLCRDGEAGEAGGFLDVVLAQIAEFQSRDKELKSKVMTAMLYPAILFVLAMIVLTVMLVFFIPKFQRFRQPPRFLPLITQSSSARAMRSFTTDFSSRRHWR